MDMLTSLALVLPHTMHRSPGISMVLQKRPQLAQTSHYQLRSFSTRVASSYNVTQISQNKNTRHTVGASEAARSPKLTLIAIYYASGTALDRTPDVTSRSILIIAFLTSYGGRAYYGETMTIITPYGVIEWEKVN